MTRSVGVCLLAWLVPGAGHLALGKRGRGLIFMALILTLFGLGLVQNGELFGLTPGFFGLLKFVANLAIGLPYLIGKLLSWGAGDIRAYGYEYGNTFLYTAGLLNMLLILDAFDFSQGRKK